MARSAAPVFPDLFSLPTGFAPEGIAVGRGHTFYTGSLSGQGIYRGDLSTGEGAILADPDARVHVGMKLDNRSNYLFVVGGPLGPAYVYDGGTGELLATFQLAAQGNFINDVVITRDAAYFTNSSAPVYYRIELGPAGELTGVWSAIPLTGDWQQVAGFNSNGIEATPDGRSLIIVNSTTGLLYLVDAATGVAEQIDLGGATVTAGDGILLAGHTLFVVRNQFNQIVEISLAPDYLSGTVVGTITDSDFNIPTTIARFGDTLYAVNAKFGTPQAGTPYEVVAVGLH